MARKPRIPTPWQRKDRNKDWYVTIRQKQYFLGAKDAPEREIQQALANLVMEMNVDQKEDAGPLLPLLGRFMDHVQLHQAPKTYIMRRDNLQSFIKFLKAQNQLDIATISLKPFHVTGWLDANPQWNSSSKRVAISSLSTCLNWCREQGYIQLNPLANRIKRPQCRSRGRETYIDEDTYKMWLGFCQHEAQKHIVISMYRTGCRPGEVIGLGAISGTGFDEAGGKWMVCGKRTKRNPSGLHEVMLDPLMIDLSKKLRAKWPTGALFRNCNGDAWRNSSLCKLFERLREQSTIENPGRADYYKKLIPYGCRHTFATNRLTEGESDTIVARHMGQEGTNTLHLHYNHVLADAAKPMMGKMTATDKERETL